MMPLDLEEIPVTGTGVRTLAAESDTSPIIQRLREKHEKVKQDKTEDFDVPGFDGLLVARYHRLAGTETDAMAAKASDLTEYNLAFLVAACEELLSRDDDGALKPLEKDYPVQYDANLATILGYTADSPRDVLLAVFDGHDLTIRSHGDDVANWMIQGKADLGK